MAVKVKICGITRVEDAVAAADTGADFIGLNFWRGTPRCVTLERAREICKEVRRQVAVVAVFVDAERVEVQRVAEELGIGIVQLHGRETRRYASGLAGLQVIKAIRMAKAADLRPVGEFPAFAYLLDAKVEGKPGGTGRTVDWALARRAAERARVLLAGGLTAENVSEAVRAVKPWGVDTASGVEVSPGIKGRFKMFAFVKAAKSAAEER